MEKYLLKKKYGQLLWQTWPCSSYAIRTDLWEGCEKVCKLQLEKPLNFVNRA